MTSQVDPASLATDLQVLGETALRIAANLRSGLADLSQGAPSASVNATSSGNDLLEADEFAALLRIDIRTLRRWRHEGRVPRPIRGGRGIRWDRRVVEQWLQERAA